MDRFRFEHLGDDVKIQGLGSLYRLVDGSQWSINIGYWPRQEKKSLRMSNAPILARQRIINPTLEHGPAGLDKVFSIHNTHDWLVRQVADCPAIKNNKRMDSKQYCFAFTLADGMTIYFPQFELARALFFHDCYLSRTSLDPDLLAAEFDVQLDKETDRAAINVMPSAEYTLKHFNESGCRRVLSWILLDENARNSYESIGKYQVLKGNDRDRYRFWDFSFEPPPLPGAKFSARGWIDHETKSMFVYEIHGIRNIKADIRSEVDFYHPKFESAVRGKGKGGNADGSKRPAEHDIHDENTANSDNQRVILRPETTDIAFDKAIKTNRIAKNKTLSKSGKNDEIAPETASKDVSTDESNVTGELPGADWNNIDDQTDDSHLYENKFTCFFEMIRLLSDKPGCSITRYPLRKLPDLPRCKKHILATDGNPRCLAVVKIEVSGKSFQVLEVDTSDADKPLSTRLMSLNSPSTWELDLVELERQLLKGSLRWLNKFLDTLCGKGNHHGIPHPKSKSKFRGALDPASVEGWAERFYSWLVEL